MSSTSTDRDANRTQNFTYDNLNRLTQAWSSGSNWGETFSVDPWGSMWQSSQVTGKTTYESARPSELAEPADRLQL